MVIDTMMSSGPKLLGHYSILFSGRPEYVAHTHIFLPHALSCLLRHMPTLVVSSTGGGKSGKTMEGKLVDNDPKYV